MATEQQYDEIVAPLLAEAAKKAHELGMSLIARVEWEPGESGITQIGDLSSIGQFMTQMVMKPTPEQIATRLMAPAGSEALWTYKQVRALIIRAVEEARAEQAISPPSPAEAMVHAESSDYSESKG